MRFIKKIALGMAFGRGVWVDKVRSALEGALGEYAKQRYASLVGYDQHDWSAEVGRLVRKLETFLDADKVKIKGTWNRDRAFKEALLEAGVVGQSQVLAAKNTIESKLSAEQRSLFHKRTRETFSDFDAEALLRDMLKEHAQTSLRIIR